MRSPPRAVASGSPVPAPDVPYLRRGLPAEVRLDAYPGEVFAGRVARLAAELDPAARTLDVEVEIDESYRNMAYKIREDPKVLAAGLRWGLEEGWALHADYQVCLSLDDLATQWQPGYPEMISTIAVSRQFPFGGRDRDGDGIVDRRDRCPRTPEDQDGYRDEDGFTELGFKYPQLAEFERSYAAIDTAFWSAERVTLTGSTMPSSSMSPYVSPKAS